MYKRTTILIPLSCIFILHLPEVLPNGYRVAVKGDHSVMMTGARNRAEAAAIEAEET